MKFPELIYLTRQGAIHTDSAALLDKSDYVQIPNPDCLPVTLKNISPGVYVVRLGDELKVILVVFRFNESYKSRVVTLHDVRPSEDMGELSVSLFGRLLSFDNNRLGNRDRNLLIPIVRQSCPEHFRGQFQNPTRPLLFSVYKNMLTVTSLTGIGLLRTNYVKLSRSIKDKL